ncbi:MAG: membrane integrity-associated transporter subunit PqiC [Neisseriaceae bacterium]|nr:membrane integrity-associated transporter subunit PqiC [Neisseriaceae bacterium]MBP6861084.1 membrane integrity-associated transporter subunit PqiC [Neisseriaceae bacterium]
MRYLPLLLTSLGLLSACASNAPTYYQLPVQVSATPSQAQIDYSVKVRMADFLNSSSMVYEVSDVEVVLSKQNLWAENPEPAIARNLAYKLNQVQGKAGFYTRGSRPNDILVQLDQFQGSHHGQVKLSGQFTIQTSGLSPTIQPFSISIAQEGDGYRAMVQALDQGLAQLAQTIASQLPNKPNVKGFLL